MSIIDKLRLRRQERALTAEETFKKLAADIWSGKKLTEDSIEVSLSECGKTDTHLERELTRLDKIAAAKAKLVDEQALWNEVRQIGLRSQQAEKELVEYRERWSLESEQRKARDAELRRKIEESRKAENTLAELREESDVDAATESRASGRVSLMVSSR
jgi:hypothetical protein